MPLAQRASDTDEPGAGFAFELPVGRYEDSLEWVGRSREVAFAEVPVNEAMIKVYAAMVEDGNLSYWDRDFAVDTWGEIVAPPGMVHVWSMPLQWHPGGVVPPVPLGALVPLPGAGFINTRAETVYSAPLRVGDHVNMVETIKAISPPKTTKLGVGHFIDNVFVYRTQRGRLIAEQTFTMLRYQERSAD